MKTTRVKNDRRKYPKSIKSCMDTRSEERLHNLPKPKRDTVLSQANIQFLDIANGYGSGWRKFKNKSFPVTAELDGIDHVYCASLYSSELGEDGFWIPTFIFLPSKKKTESKIKVVEAASPPQPVKTKWLRKLMIFLAYTSAILGLLVIIATKFNLLSSQVCWALSMTAASAGCAALPLVTTSQAPGAGSD